MLRSMEKAIRARRERDFDRIAVAIGYIADHVRDQPSLEQIAAAVGLSPYHFARLFRQWAGISPKQYLQRLSLDSAQRALSGHASVLDAALDAGLSGPGRLHDLSVAIDAVTPGEFKARGHGVEFVHGFVDESWEAPGWAAFEQTWSRADWRESDSAAQRVADAIWGLRAGQGHRIRLWVHGSNFQVQVWQALLNHAADATVSYAELAREIGRPAASRAVGNAVGANPVAWLIPCHHVLRANGALGGYRWGIDRKRAMLAWEVARSVANAS
jgi:AraC family transcriptional regulator of adaptative response/methylated-DNA-[protein]-cysteine methyltransferase